MTRPPRLWYPGARYHVIQRGVERRPVFVDNADRDRFLEATGRLAQRYGHRLHAWCLMTNHVHLVVQSGAEPLSRYLQGLFGSYAQTFNRRHRRSGHLFQGRYQAVLVESDPYLLELVRYVHLNPVRAGICPDPADYEHSSHRAFLGTGPVPRWLDIDSVLGHFSSRRSEARGLYADFVQTGGRGDVSIDFIRGNDQKYNVLVPDGFAAEVAAKAEIQHLRRVDLDRIIAVVSDAYRLTVDEMAATGRRAAEGAEARAAAAFLTRRYAVRALSELGRRLNRRSNTLRDAALRLERWAQTNEALWQRLERLTAVLEGAS